MAKFKVRNARFCYLIFFFFNLFLLFVFRLRKRLPGETDGGKSEASTSTKKLVEVKVVQRKPSNDVAYQELVKRCRDSENEEDDVERKISMDTTDEIELTETSNGNAEQYDEHYDSLGESYFQNEAITLKVINDQIGMHLLKPNHKVFVLILKKNRFFLFIF